MKTREELIKAFREQTLSDEDRLWLEQQIESGDISIDELGEDRWFDERMLAFDQAVPSQQQDLRFYETLEKEKAQRVGGITLNSWLSPRFWVPRLALASLMLVLGVLIGYFLQSGSAVTNDEQIAQLSNQVDELKEMMMLSLLEKESATERLRAVSLTEEMNSVSQTVTKALLQTLNHDSNINVRLAALDALKPYAKDDTVRAELVRSIARQQSPLVQVALAELMSALQVKSSVKEFEKILDNEQTPAEVKDRIRKSLEVMS